MRVLCVDDCEIHLALLEAQLTRRGHEPVLVQNSEEALLANLDFDLIIIDVNLGIENGFELYANMKKKHGCAFIITSGLLPKIDISVLDGDCIVSKENLILEIEQRTAEHGQPYR